MDGKKRRREEGKGWNTSATTVRKERMKARCSGSGLFRISVRVHLLVAVKLDLMAKKLGACFSIPFSSHSGHRHSRALIDWKKFCSIKVSCWATNSILKSVTDWSSSASLLLKNPKNLHSGVCSGSASYL